MHSLSSIKLAVIGLGYVGLPLALAFSKVRKVVGFDKNSKRIFDLRSGVDHTLEFESNSIIENQNLSFTDDVRELQDCNCYIVTVPTPIDKMKAPDKSYVEQATTLIGSLISKMDIVIYESTVYPGLTEEFCVPILEKISKLKYNREFFCGYSPERINPGDKNHKLEDIIKVTSGSNQATAELVDALYKQIIKAGTHLCKSIKVAEAAKVIENTQRDINIALINELSIIFEKMQINTEDVLNAAETKWNFLSFRPGLVGGHCIGVDPYYLTHKAQKLGFQSKMILAGRETNECMPDHVVNLLQKKMKEKKIGIKNARILLLGLSFKENCPDIRNSKVKDIFSKLSNFGCKVDVFDPWVEKAKAYEEYQINLLNDLPKNSFDAIIICVAHEQFKKIGIGEIRSLGKKNHVLFDLKFVFPVKDTDLRL